MDLPGYADFVDQVNPSCASLSHGCVAAVQGFEGAHGKPLEVLTWTVDEPAAARRAAGFGVDGIISNKPDVTRDAMSG